ncbi:hypothetical protein EI74_0437 [Mycoplasma testudineum]|uniref:DUF3899 domain-containing protein n=1 Tax=Mycoplasma testudineum TaxID=244584 RepID=A0A4V3C330_9MOLU|nr:hypothetical protein [Mycoplasma testudineum]OYD26825.1 hypothetical protein CG473_01805 [Mycoplasma testudineum]TDO20359.1 hypothetical protein EI74_0437 [Mycoplasma testudineum]
MKQKLKKIGFWIKKEFNYKILIVALLFNLLVIIGSILWWQYGHKIYNIWTILMSLSAALIVINILLIIITKTGFMASLIKPGYDFKKRRDHNKKNKWNQDDYVGVDEYHFRKILEDKNISVFVLTILMALFLIVLSLPFVLVLGPNF